ncbi:hypothetical protein GGF46_003740 [Coemansia sp. RSA 552]|nr:hypothetical protein GGF46_003740 [Coemansia sp. RSA 552]
MAEPAVFEICFPSHITRVPVCRPGETVAGVVVLKLSSPLAASHILLRFCGAERVRRTPVAVRTELLERKQQTTTMGQKMVMDKEFFRRELVLWGEPKQSSVRIIPSDNVHRFHFSFTMPYVNMPTPRQTPDIEISYSLEASLFSEVLDQQRGEKVLRDIHKTASKHLRFEPVVRQFVSCSGPSSSVPYEVGVPMNDATPPTTMHSGPKAASPALSSIPLLPFQSSKRSYMNLNVFQPSSAFLPGETVELLLLTPTGKKITGAAFQLRETVRCRKSSAPIIDESDVPILWKYSVDLTPPQEMSFHKLSRSTLTQDIGMLGRFMFTSHSGPPASLASDRATIVSPHQPQSTKSISDSSSVTTAGKPPRNPRGNTDQGLAITNAQLSNSQQQQHQQRLATQLSPLTESQEVAAGHVKDHGDDLDSGKYGSRPQSHVPHPASHSIRTRTGSLGTIQSRQPYQQDYAHPQSATPPARSRPTMSTSVSTPYYPASLIGLGSRMSKAIHHNPDAIEDSASERSSISDTLSVRYLPTTTKSLGGSTFPSLTRGASIASNANKYINRVGVTPVPLGGLLSKGSFKFAKIQFTLPPITEMSPVSSVYLDFEYTVDISMTIGGSFGTSKKAVGKLPLRIATTRTAVKTDRSGSVDDTGSQALSDPMGSTHSLRDSLSCLNLSIAHSDDTPLGAGSSNASPATTLTEIHFEGPGSGSKLADSSYPCLLSFIENGERVPTPELEIINIGTSF